MAYTIKHHNGVPLATPSTMGVVHKCPLQYAIRYWLHPGKQTNTSATDLGSFIHDYIEDNYLNLDYDKALNAFMKHLKGVFGKELGAMVLEYGQMWLSAIEDTERYSEDMGYNIPRYPMHSSYFRSQHAHKFRTMLKVSQAWQTENPDFDVYGTLLDYYTQGLRCIDNMMDMVPLIQESLTGEGFKERINVEASISPVEHPFTKEAMGGTTDVFHFSTGRTKASLSVYDFKTGRTPWTQDKVRNSHQLKWYAYCIARNNDLLDYNLQVRNHIYDLYQGKIHKVILTGSDLLEFEKEITPNLLRKQNIDAIMKTKGKDGLSELDNALHGGGYKACPCEFVDKCPVYKR